MKGSSLSRGPVQGREVKSYDPTTPLEPTWPLATVFFTRATLQLQITPLAQVLFPLLSPLFPRDTPVKRNETRTLSPCVFIKFYASLTLPRDVPGRGGGGKCIEGHSREGCCSCQFLRSYDFISFHQGVGRSFPLGTGLFSDAFFCRFHLPLEYLCRWVLCASGKFALTAF